MTVLNQWATVGFERLASPKTLGRLDVPVLATELASTGVKGSPVCAVRIMLTCQFPKIAFCHRFEKLNRLPAPKGNWYRTVCVRRCRRSKELLARSR